MQSSMQKFMKINQKKEENYFLPVTKTLTEETEIIDNKGQTKTVEVPIKWEFKVLDSDYCEQLKKDYEEEVEVFDKKKGIKTYRTKFDGQGYLIRLAIESCVMPNLKDIELQESYGVHNEEDLLYAMVPTPGEFSQLLVDIQRKLGFTDLLEDVAEAKN